MQQLVWHDLQQCLRRMPVAVLKLMKAHGRKLICAGGYVRAVVTGETASDVDLFSPSKDVAEVLAKSLYTDTHGKSGDYYASDNAVTVRLPQLPVQFIHRWTFDSPLACLESFDFTIACAAFWWNEEGGTNGLGAWESMCDDRFYADAAGKRLIYRCPVREEEPGGSLLRVLKFYQRGYRIPLDSFAEVMARMMVAVDEDKIRTTMVVERASREQVLSHVLVGLLREVDPNLNHAHVAYLPAEEAGKEETASGDTGGAPAEAAIQ